MIQPANRRFFIAAVGSFDVLERDGPAEQAFLRTSLHVLRLEPFQLERGSPKEFPWQLSQWLVIIAPSAVQTNEFTTT